MTIHIVLFSLVVILYAKWIIYVLTLPLIRMVQQRRVGKVERKSSSESMLNSPQAQSQISLLHKLELQCRRYLAGYMRYADFQTGLIPSHHIRDFLYRNVWLVDMGKDVIIYFGAEIRAAEKLHLGKGSIIGDKAILDARRGGIYIGENVNFGSQVHLWTGQHDYNDPYFRSMPGRRGPIRIGNRAWIGPNVTILHSVTIGEGAVVAAGAVVTKDVEPYTLVGGIPAKKIGERNRNLCYEFDGNPIPFY